MEKFCLKIYYILYGILFIVLSKYVYDFYSLSRHEYNSVFFEDTKIILKPRLQIENENYYHIMADIGNIMENNNYELFNIKMRSNLGEGTGDKGFIMDKNLVKMYGNIKFKLYKSVN